MYEISNLRVNLSYENLCQIEGVLNSGHYTLFHKILMISLPQHLGIFLSASRRQSYKTATCKRFRAKHWLRTCANSRCFNTSGEDGATQQDSSRKRWCRSSRHTPDRKRTSTASCPQRLFASPRCLNECPFKAGEDVASETEPVQAHRAKRP